MKIFYRLFLHCYSSTTWNLVCTCMHGRHLPCSIRSIYFTCFTYIVVKWPKTHQFIFLINVLHCSIFSMPRIPNNLRERAICMLDAGISTEHVARHVECSSRVIRNRLRENGLHAQRPYVGCVLMQCHREFNSVLYFTQTIIYMVPEVIKQYNNYSSMKANKKFMKLMGEQS